jgi:hypothetical protein
MMNGTSGDRQSTLNGRFQGETPPNNFRKWVRGLGRHRALALSRGGTVGTPDTARHPEACQRETAFHGTQAGRNAVLESQRHLAEPRHDDTVPPFRQGEKRRI